MRGWPARRSDAAVRSERARVQDAHAGDYEGAMAAVRHALAEIDAAHAQRGDDVVRAVPVAPAVLRGAHDRVDGGLARAAAAAAAVYDDLFEAAGGMYHAESDPEVARWKRHMNTALTLRSQHQLSQPDDEAAVSGRPLAGVHPRTRAAYGPHQAGVDFDVHLDASG